MEDDKGHEPGEKQDLSDKEIKEREDELQAGKAEPRNVEAGKAEPRDVEAGKAEPNWDDFTRNTTFHGLRFVFQHNTDRRRRLLWLVIVTCALTGFVVEVGWRVNDYFLYKTNVDVQKVYTDSLNFPSVTICNQNTYRLTQTVRWRLYTFIDAAFESENPSLLHLDSHLASTVDSREFHLAVAHDKHDFIESCLWHSLPCNVSTDFLPVLTDLGLCYQFKPPDHTYSVSQAGSGSGLTLVLNVEQYEYMRGPQNDAGIKVLLHEHEDLIQMNDHGFAAAPGSHTLVSINKQQVYALEPPYGLCRKGQEPRTVCEARCKAEQKAALCGCSEFYVQLANVSTCNLYDDLICIREAKGQLVTNATQCDCPVACDRVTYDPIMSFSQLSKFNLQRVVMNGPGMRAAVQKRLHAAMEISQRVVKETVTSDNATISGMLNIIGDIKEAIRISHMIMDDAEILTEYFHIPDFISRQDKTLRDEMRWINKLKSNLNDAVFRAQFESSLSVRTVRKIRSLMNITDGKVPDIEERIQQCREVVDTSYQMGYDDDGEPLADETFDIEEPYFSYESGFGQPLVQENYGAYLYGSGGDSYKEEQQCMITHILDMDEYLKFITFIESIEQETESIQSSIESEITSLFNGYNEMIDVIYNNSFTPVNDKHQKCLRVLKTLNDTFMPDLVTTLSLFKRMDHDCSIFEGEYCNKMYENIGKTITSRLFSNIHDLSNSMQICNWVYEAWSEETSNGKYTNLDTALSLAVQHDTSIKYSFKKITSYHKDMQSLFLVNANQISQNLTHYVLGNQTKENMAAELCSRTLETLIMSLSEMVSVMHSQLANFDSYIGSYSNDLVNIFSLLLKRNIPLVSNDTILDSKYINIVLNAQPEFKSVLDNDEDLPKKQLFQAILDGVSMINKNYSTAMKHIREHHMYPMMQFIQNFDKLKVSLIEYQASLNMDASFVMENFLQLDIFYSQLSYERIEQQEAFQFSSLLSEVGGFLGLLLGASVITVFELLDHLLLLLFSRCR